MTTSENLLVNGDLEEGLDGWTWSGTVGGTARVHGGRGAIELAPPAGDSATLVQEVDLPVSGVSTLSFWYLSNCGAMGIQQVTVSAPAATAPSVRALEQCDTSTTWRSVTRDLDGLAGLRARLVFHARGPGLLTIDDVSIVNRGP